MRLIDADAFKEQVAAIAITNNLPADKCASLCELIEMQPTADSWHRVADGDLPPEPKCEDDVKRYLTAQKSIRGPYYINDITKYYGNLPCAELNLWWWQEHCAAWMELPEYKEEQDKQ